jgi:hypothetical protein
LSANAIPSAESGFGLVPVGLRTRRMHNALFGLGGRAAGQRHLTVLFTGGTHVVGSVVWGASGAK